MPQAVSSGPQAGRSADCELFVSPLAQGNIEESHAHCNRIYNTITPELPPHTTRVWQCEGARKGPVQSKWSKMFGATGNCTRTILGAIFSQASRSQQIATFIQQDEWRLTIYMCAHNSGGQDTLAGIGEQGSPHNGLKLKTVIATRYRVHKQLPLVCGRGREGGRDRD